MAVVTSQHGGGYVTTWRRLRHDMVVEDGGSAGSEAGRSEGTSETGRR